MTFMSNEVEKQAPSVLVATSADRELRIRTNYEHNRILILATYEYLATSYVMKPLVALSPGQSIWGSS
jgi:hypothetical protein